CLDAPAPASNEPGPFHVTFHLTDAVSAAAQSGVVATLCKKLDVTCDQPIGAPVTSDADGNVAFDVDRGFSGDVSFTRADLAPGLFFFDSSVDRDLEALPVQVLSPGLVGALTQTAGSTLLPDRGVLLLSIFDCAGKGASGVSFRAEGMDAT